MLFTIVVYNGIHRYKEQFYSQWNIIGKHRNTFKFQVN